MIRFLSRLTGRTVRIALLVVAVTAGLVVTAARTQVGRDALARRIESEFAARMNGRLEIGRLSGNLLRRFTATDVVLFDAIGRRVVRVDTVIVSPSWEHLLRRRLVMPRVELRAPRAELVVEDDGTTNLERIFRRPARTDSADVPSPWEFRSVHAVVSRGSVMTARATGPDSLERLPPWHRLSVVDLSIDALAERSEETLQFDILAASLRDPGLGIDLRAFEAQLVSRPGVIELTHGRAELGSSRLSAAGRLERADSIGAPVYQARIAAEEFSASDLGAWIPPLPVAGVYSAEIALQGVGRAVEVARMELASGTSSLSGSGSVQLHADSVRFAVTLERSSLAASDLRTNLPTLPLLDGMAFRELRLSGSARGAVATFEDRLSLVRAAGDLTVEGDAGGIGAVYDVEWAPDYRTRLQVDARTDRLDLAVLGGYGFPSTSLTGTVFVDAQGSGLLDLNGTVTLRVRPSRIGSRRVERAELNAFAVDEDATASVTVIQPEGRFRGDVAWRRADPAGGFLRAAWNTFDFGTVISDSLVTRASGRLDVTFDGASDADLSGSLTLALDSTHVDLRGTSFSLSPQLVRASLAKPGGTGPRLVVEAQAARVEISGDTRLEVARAVVPFWVGALGESVRSVFNKPYAPGSDRGGPVAPDNSRELAASLRRGDVASLVVARDGEPVRLSARVEIRDAGLLQGLPGLPAWGGNPRADLTVVVSPDSVRQALSLRADSLRFGGSRLSGVDLYADGIVRLDVPESRRLEFALRADADSATTATVTLPRAVATVEFRGSEGALRVRTSSSGEFGPLVLAAGLTSLPDRNRVTVDSLSLRARNYDWSLESPAGVSAWRDAISVRGLTVSSPSGGEVQRVRVDGTWSRSPGDSLVIVAEGVRLAEVTRFASLRQSFGGRLDGRVAVSGSGGRTVVVGDVDADGFILDGRVLGDVRASSRLVPGSPEIALAVHLLPADSAAVRQDGAREYRRNEVHLVGTVRLPGPATGDPGAWNLSLDAPRVDLFFLKYIFTDSIDRVAGHLSGAGRVSGTYRRPVFDVRLSARDGRFGVPVTGVSYGLEGEVTVDRDAIRLERVRVQDPGGGSAVASGRLLFNEYRFFSFDVSAGLDRLLVIDTPYTDELPFYGTVRGTGTATLQGPLAAATLRIPDGRTTDDSELFIPIIETAAETDDSFIVFADSTGRIPDLRQLARRPNLLARRATVERRFLDGLDMDINLFAPRGSIVHLVIDPLLGDVINAESTGRVQIQRSQGEFEIFGRLEVEGGDYLFTAGEVFVRRFLIEEGGTITWESDPIDAVLDIPAVYRTRASTAGLDASGGGTSALIPLVVQLQITGRVLAPAVDLRLAVDRSSQNVLGDYQALEARLNNPEKSTEYATSVLLTNSFQLTTERIDTRSGEQLAFNSVSQLVSAQLNRFLNAALPNLDVNFGLLGERAQDLDITYGVALRLLDERLIIRGEGVYQGSRTDVTSTASESLQGEVVVEIRLNPTVSVEVFFRREGDILQASELTNTTGAGLTYQTEFTSWRRFFRRLLGQDS